MYYKIIHGFGVEDYIGIDETELQKAYYCFLEKKDSIFSGGAIKGSQILEIKPDFHRIMGWNKGHKLGADDYEELGQKGIDKKTQHFLSATKDVVQHLIETNQTHLIGKASLLINQPNVRSGGMKSIAEINNEKE